jgi:hypothetical protein
MGNIFRLVKNHLIRPGRRSRAVPCGIYAGLQLNLDLATEFQIYVGLWERETYRWITACLNRSDWMIDVGAGKGELPLLFAKQPNIRKVVAIEPSASECQILRDNIASNLHSIEVPLTIIQKFVGTTLGENYVSLDEISTDCVGRGFIKVDVDHFELDVLASASKTLALRNTYWLIENHTRELEENCIRIFTENGFSTTILKNAWWRVILPEQRPSQQCRWLAVEPFFGQTGD